MDLFFSVSASFEPSTKHSSVVCLCTLRGRGRKLVCSLLCACTEASWPGQLLQGAGCGPSRRRKASTCCSVPGDLGKTAKVDGGCFLLQQRNKRFMGLGGRQLSTAGGFLATDSAIFALNCRTFNLNSSVQGVPMVCVLCRWLRACI